MSSIAMNPSVVSPKLDGTPAAARSGRETVDGPASTRFPKLAAVLRRERRLRVMTSCVPALAFVAAAGLLASWLLG